MTNVSTTNESIRECDEKGRNIMNEQRIILFTHTDLDGISCEIIMTNCYRYNNTYKVCNILDYNDIDESFTNFLTSNEYLNYDKIFMTDISFKQDETLINLINEKIADKFVLLDHHKSAEWLNEYSWATVKTINDNGTLTCGTELLYNYLISENPDLFIKNRDLIEYYVELVRLHDTYEFKKLDPTSETFMNVETLNTYFKFVDLFDFSNKITNNLTDYNIIISEDMEYISGIIKNKRNKYIEKKIKSASIRNDIFNGYNVAIIFAEECASEIGWQANNRFDNIDFVAIIDMATKICSLRSKEGRSDVSLIAKEFGGGGHKFAAAFKF